MLYPSFTELVSLRGGKASFKHPSRCLVKSIVSGGHHSPFRGQGLEFDSVREYVPGDDIRNIDWRVTARTGAPHLKLFEEERERQILICVDANAAMRFGTRKTFKSVQAAHIAAYLGWKGLAQHDRVSTCLFGDVADKIHFFPSSRTHKSFCMFLKTLSEPPLKKNHVPLEAALKQIAQNARTGSLVYIISDFMDIGNKAEYEAGLSRLKKRCDVVLIAVNDPSDKAFPPVGALALCADELVKITVNTDSRTGRESYEAQWKKDRELLYAMTSRYKIPLIELSTQSDIRRDLSLLLKRLK